MKKIATLCFLLSVLFIGCNDPDQPEQCLQPRINPDKNYVFTDDVIYLSPQTPGSDIYYTTDGSIPNKNSIKYTGSFQIEEPSTIKAIAVIDGMLNSEILIHAYKLQKTVTVKVESTSDSINEIGLIQYTDPSYGPGFVNYEDVTLPWEETVDVTSSYMGRFSFIHNRGNTHAMPEEYWLALEEYRENARFLVISVLIGNEVIAYFSMDEYLPANEIDYEFEENDPRFRIVFSPNDFIDGWTFLQLFM